MAVLAEVSWPILERIPVYGSFQLSPHGITVAVGFLVGAQLMLNRAKARGVARRHVDDVESEVQSVLTRVAIGGILGARLFYVLTRVEQFSDPFAALQIWDGGLSLLGGITGGILTAIPYIIRRRLSVPLLMDSAATGLALGIFVGRIGDIIIGEHLGGPTSFFLGWRCSGAFRDAGAPYPFPGPSSATVQGCFDTALHQTALYDFLAAGVVFFVLLTFERRPRFDGFFMLAFAVLYGTGRFITDFARDADKDLLGTLTGSQLTALGAIATALLWVGVRRPHTRDVKAWNPPHFTHPWDTEQAAEDVAQPTEMADTSAPAPDGLAIRQLQSKDAAAAARLHEAELPHGFFPKLGVTFLRQYYQGFALSPHAVGLIAEHDGGLAGVAVGMLDRRQHFLWLLRQRGMRLGFAAAFSLLRRPLAVAPLFAGRLRRYGSWLLRARSQSSDSSSPEQAPPVAVLAHVAVAPHARGHGAGTSLVHGFLEASAVAGRGLARVTTLDGPRGAAEFYQRTGWTLQVSAVDWDGDRILVFSRSTEGARSPNDPG